MKLGDIMWEAHEPSETAKLFHQTADAQRGPPEAMMMKIQSLVGGGVYSFVVEHVGDITHRMAEKFDYGKGQLGIVHDKVRKTLRALDSGYGFEKEMMENFESNFRFFKENGRENFNYETIEDFINAARKLSQLYAFEHSKIPVFNEPQWHARQAAIELGKWNFKKAAEHLRWLWNLTEDDDRYEQEVAKVTMHEGMDNSFFLSKDMSAGPTIYPLPTDATEYELAEDEGTWYHGSPEIQKLGGEFEARTVNVDYLSDPKKWMMIQQELAKYPSGSDEYMDLLDAARDIRKTKRIRSPIFLSNKHEVANTYADDRRAFDYQSAVPGIAAVEVLPGRTLTINGAGQDFRGISIDSVRRGLLKAGYDEDTIKNEIAKFTHQIRGDGGTISTTSLAAIVDDLGFDIIDVTHIKDNYMGAGPPATVRMVMNPALIKIKTKQEGPNR